MPNALETAAKLNIPVIIMHMRGEPTTMNGLDQYDNVTLDVMTELSQRVSDALKAGVKAENIMIISVLALLKMQSRTLAFKRIPSAKSARVFYLSASSRKRSSSGGSRRGRGRAVAGGFCSEHLLQIQQGACMVRAHDVKAMSDAIKVWQAMNMADGGGGMPR